MELRGANALDAGTDHVLELQPLRENGQERFDAAGPHGFAAGASPAAAGRLPFGDDDTPELPKNLLLLHTDNMLPTAVRLRTMFVLNLAFIMERADEAVLPAGEAARPCAQAPATLRACIGARGTRCRQQGRCLPEVLVSGWAEAGSKLDTAFISREQVGPMPCAVSRHACAPMSLCCRGQGMRAPRLPAERTSVAAPDAALTPCAAARAAFKFIGAALGATPTQLGQITLSRALVQAASSPMAGLLGDRLDRVHLIATGCLLWAACTAAIGMSRTLLEARAGPARALAPKFCSHACAWVWLTVPCLCTLVPVTAHR